MLKTTLLWLTAFAWAGIVLAADGPLFGEPRSKPVIHAGVAVALNEDGDASGRIGVWVFLTDKNIRSRDEYRDAISRVGAQYDSRAVRRRSLRRTAPGLFDHRDLPLAKGYVDQILAAGVQLRTRSKWLNAVSVEADSKQIKAMAALPFVRSIRPLARSVSIDPPKETPAQGETDNPRDFYGRSSGQLHQINIPAAHDAGFTGDGIIIGILDTGFVRTHDAFNEPGHELDVLGTWDFINDDPDVGIEAGDPGSQHWHGTAILGTIGAYKPNELVGGAFDASFFLAKTEDISREEPIEEDFYVAGLEWIEANGADLATSSLAYIDWYTQADLDGQTAVTTIAVNIATANGLACCTAAGNMGNDQDPETSHLMAPADAFEVVTCGSVNSEGESSSFSGDGPTADGRLKPEVLAQGESTATVNPDDDHGYTEVSGTSLSTPLVAAAVALVIDAHPDWSVKQIRSALFQSAWDFPELPDVDPLFIRGYGIVDVMAAILMDFVADLDGDGDTDAGDFAIYLDCYTGPGIAPTPECESADLDQDNDVDRVDFFILQLNTTGSWEG